MRAIYATDLSAASEAAIENETCLECLDRVSVETIHLITVVPSNVHAGMPGMDLEGRRERALQQYRSVMENAGFAVETHVVRGTPHRRINGLAETVRADMTIVGSRGQSPLENRVIGSTARNLARTTVVPLLVWRRGAEQVGHLGNAVVQERPGDTRAVVDGMVEEFAAGLLGERFDCEMAERSVAAHFAIYL
jgi:nucleotide-binding universal stress UspA family protein